jgi:hypothetical protein
MSPFCCGSLAILLLLLLLLLCSANTQLDGSSVCLLQQLLPGRQALISAAATLICSCHSQGHGQHHLPTIRV